MKSSDFLIYGIKSLSQTVLPKFEPAILTSEFDSFEDVRELFEGGISLPTDEISKICHLPVLKELFRTDGEQVLKFPPPHVIKGVLHILIELLVISMALEKFTPYI